MMLCACVCERVRPMLKCLVLCQAVKSVIHARVLVRVQQLPAHVPRDSSSFLPSLILFSHGKGRVIPYFKHH